MGLFDLFKSKPDEPAKLAVPCEARITRWVESDGVGSLVVDGKLELRFGYSACTFPRDVVPRVGQRVIVGAVAPHPLGGLRATSLALHPDEIPPPAPERAQRENEPVPPEEERAVARERARAEQRARVEELRATLAEETDAGERPFLEAIADAPDAREPYLVYSDFLQAQGDPRGELIALDAHRKGPVPAAKPRLDGLPDEGPALSCTYRLGLIETARIAYDESADEIVDAEELFVALRRHPMARALRSLVVGLAEESSGDHSYAKLFAAIAAVGVWPTLERLYVGDFTHEELEVSWAHHGFLEPVWPRLARLRSLILRGGSFDFGSIDLPSLRSLFVITGGFSRENLEDVRGARLPALEGLELFFGDASYGCDVEVDDVEFMLDKKSFPRIHHLGLTNAMFADELPSLLASSTILPQLRSLCLGLGTLGRRGAEAILEHRHAFAHLERLDLRESYVPKALHKRLRAVCPTVILEDQRGDDDDDDDERYVSITE